MSELPLIASFWFGSNFCFLEQVVAQSYMDRGHRFRLYVLDEVGGVPEGVEVRDAREVMAELPFELDGCDRHRVAVFSDIFRLHLLTKVDCIWVDMDAYCVQPFDFAPGVLCGVNETGRALTGVMGLPRESECLRQMLAFVMSQNPIQPWRAETYQSRRVGAAAKGKRWEIVDLPWGCSGPKAFNHFLEASGEYRHAQSQTVFYPLLKETVPKLWQAGVPVAEIERDGTRSVHFFGFAKRSILRLHGGVSPEGSYLARICARHGVDMAAAPIAAKGWLAG